MIGSNPLSFDNPEQEIIDLVRHCLSPSSSQELSASIKSEHQTELDRHVFAFTAFLDGLAPKNRSFYILKFTDCLLNALKSKLLTNGIH